MIQEQLTEIEIHRNGLIDAITTLMVETSKQEQPDLDTSEAEKTVRPVVEKILAGNSDDPIVDEFLKKAYEKPLLPYDLFKRSFIASVLWTLGVDTADLFTPEEIELLKEHELSDGGFKFPIEV